MKTALFPGSFDPIHNGHIALAKTAADTLGLDRVVFIPSGVSPNKRNKQRTLGSTRYNWIAAALSALGDKRLTVTSFESRHTHPTYTLETIEALKVEKEETFLLVGADTAARMKRWPSHDKIQEIAKVITFGRSGEPGTIQAPEWPHASSDIRKRIEARQSIKGLVPDAIEKEIIKHFNQPEIQ